MTLRELVPDWWCKITFSFPENCYGDYNWLDFSIYEFIFSIIVVFILKWIINFLFFLIGQIIPDKTMDASIISPSLLGKDLDILNDEMGGIKDKILDFDEDVFSLEEESNKKTADENIDKEIETSIVNITRKGINK